VHQPGSVLTLEDHLAPAFAANGRGWVRFGCGGPPAEQSLPHRVLFVRVEKTYLKSSNP
jgi:hypothetical protein